MSHNHVIDLEIVFVAAKILPVVRNQHLLLCTLLIGNALAMEVSSFPRDKVNYVLEHQRALSLVYNAIFRLLCVLY